MTAHPNHLPASEPYEPPYAGNEDMWEARPRAPWVVPRAEKEVNDG